MAVKLRLRRMGAKKRPFFRLVAAESTDPRNGRFLETVGYYHPIAKPAKVVVDEEKVFQWLKQGARPTEAVNALFRRIGVNRKWQALAKGADVSTMALLTELPERKKAKKRKAKQEKAAAGAPAP